MDYLERFKLTGKVAIVTGGSKGLGRSMALGMGEAGARVVVTSRTVSLIEEAANEIVKRGGEAIAVPVDVNDPRSIEQMVSRVTDHYGRVDILVNNAGVTALQRTMDTSIEDWDNILNTNLRSAFIASKAVAKGMIKQRQGKIINIGSVLGYLATNVALPYCASKAGIAHLTRALALDWAPFGINVNCIAPGYFETEMTQEAREDETHMKFLKFKIPFRRLGRPEEIVGAALFLASDASSYMTGAVLYVDGGYTIW